MRSSAPQKTTASKQSLAVKESNENKVTYKDSNGNDVSLSRYIINTFLAPNANFSESECYGLIGLAQAKGLNPLARDCYFQKYNGVPSVIISKDYYEKRANKNPNYRGKQCGIVIAYKNESGKLVSEEREGKILLDDETLIGGWCKVYMKNLDYPVHETVMFNEAVKQKQDGQPQATWKSMPCTMIEKVAISRALKSAMTEEFGGTYSAEELGFDENELSSDVREVSETPQAQEAPAQKSKPEPENVMEAEFTEVDENTGEVLDMEDMEFAAMQENFFK